MFVDNHDNQRGHGAGGHIVNYKDGATYDLAVAFMLAHPYGYPKVMSSYAFEDAQQGPPDSSPQDDVDGCGKEWVCEHRRPAISNLVAFRKAAHGADLVNWQIVDDTIVSFGRGEKGHIIINTGNDTADVEVPTGLPEGEYVDLVSGSGHGMVDAGGALSVTLGPQSAFAILAKP